MKHKFHLVVLFCILIVTASAQNRQSASFNIGDAVSPLRVQSWIKGTPVQNFEKGKVYVVDFWATWCRPCLVSMPHVSALAHEYKDEVTFLAIDILEDKRSPKTPIEQIKTLVDTMGARMDFSVAVDDGNFMADHWVKASNENSIPSDFVVNAQGRLAWIGNPVDLDGVLPKIIDHTWDIRKASSERIFNRHLEELDFKESDKVRSRYMRNYDSLGYHFVNPDSALLAINEIIKREPKLKYAPHMALFTFWALLETNQHKAYEYGKKVIVTYTYREPASYFIIGKIEDFSHRIKNPEEMYRLGAEAYQSEIDSTNPIYWKLLDLPEIYRKMAAWYRLAGDTSKAREAEQKAIKNEVLAKSK